MATPTREALTFSLSHRQQIDPYNPPSQSPPSIPSKPYITLTFATSLDSQLSLSPGTQTLLSGPESKAMTHYLRSRHSAILVGAGTAIADNPSLNCRIEGVGGYGGEGLVGQPRPVVVDPNGSWEFSAESKVIKLAGERRGRAPWVLSCRPLGEEKVRVLEGVGGRNFIVDGDNSTGRLSIDWDGIFRLLAEEGIESVMVEGGGFVINELLSPRYFQAVDSVIITIAPTWLGKGGVLVCPDERVENGERLPVGRLRHVKWVPLGEDVVLCGRPKE